MSKDTPKESKFFRVATEGATTDGRVIERAWIVQMAANFDPKKYAARVWVEHLRSTLPDGPFRAFGDVLALQSRDVEDGKKALFAQIKPLPDLVSMTRAGQKLYTSIEVNPKFADSGEAYLVGLAVTDTPASLGTEMLTFAQQHPEMSPLKARKQQPENLFTAAQPTDIEFEGEDGSAAKFSAAMQAILAKFSGKARSDDTRFADVVKGFEEVAEVMGEQAAELDAQKKAHDKLASDFAALSTKHGELVAKLENTPAGNHSQRPAATGGADQVLADC
ncbi:phage capsid protein [Paracidovorax avenae]|uniref:GPO family capsid scaffolding protein n=1 Tax=Paracidovorax avenae TaxID=80867 RepID=UPI000D21EC68|nr:GPO family capsid scaffolding protein [Paracidovorax avenae]AVS66655.1 phage capsid protein [Paracidovorax avenae]